MRVLMKKSNANIDADHFESTQKFGTMDKSNSKKMKINYKTQVIRFTWSGMVNLIKNVGLVPRNCELRKKVSIEKIKFIFNKRALKIYLPSIDAFFYVKPTTFI
ncbi:MAG: hypothetical protein RLZZ628_329 [Bacteroidota bacterium]|jgi:hypothetical protein